MMQCNNRTQLRSRYGPTCRLIRVARFTFNFNGNFHKYFYNPIRLFVRSASAVGIMAVSWKGGSARGPPREGDPS
jgi:hypothetical protein